MTIVYEKAASLPEALALYGAFSGKHLILAGGTDIVAQMKTGTLKADGLIDISSISELKTISEDDDFIELGALVTHSNITSNDLIKRHIPVLSDAAGTIGAVQIQNRGTIGGNIMNASPAADLPPALLACSATLCVEDVKGSRWIDADKFYTGYRKTSLATGEVLTKIRIPKFNKDDCARFYKVGTRRAQAISKIVMCVKGRLVHGGIRSISIAIGSVAPTVLRAYGTEALLKGKMITPELIEWARKSLVDEVHPIDDVRSTANYRRFVCGNLIARYLREATSFCLSEKNHA